MVKKTTPSSKPRLISWFLNQPLRFALLSFLLVFVISFVYGAVSGMVTGSAEMFAVTPLICLIALVFIFTIWLQIRWLPSTDLDRRSFVALDNGLTLISYTIVLIPVIFMLVNPQKAILYGMWLQYYSMPLFVFASTVVALLYLYVFGVYISMLQATYRRARTMGVPRWKAIMTIPFTLSIFWFPGYMIADDKKTKPTVEIKSKWFAKWTDWVVAKPMNAIIMMFVFLGFACIGSGWLAVTTIAGIYALCAIWIWVMGPQNFRKKVGGAFATLLGALNIAAIIGCIVWGVHMSKQISQMQTYQSDVVIESAYTESM